MKPFASTPLRPPFPPTSCPARTTLEKATSTSSKYSLRVRVRNAATYRVRILGHADHAMGISRERVLTPSP